ncbi:MAG TPA: efflux RND transporter periplasmic adaptor subunit [Verrucomicrobiae bacterium]|jgi:RND family efflux transporter MFP subunit|nr:efflux RND transporter periplasmic adaptor subunit [Verrucomicrobiae bacterium]
MKKNILIAILILAAIVGGIYYALARTPAKIILTGIVTTDEVIVSPEIQGRLQNLFVKEGDVVTNGELLAEIQPQTQQADVQFYASSEQQAAAAVAQAKADLENARLTFEREGNLYTNNSESAQAYDSARTAYDSAKARVESLNKQTQAAGAQKEKAAVQLGYTKIFAPTNGIVDTRAALQGEVVNSGQAIVTLINQDDLWVRADVEETYIDRIHLGDKLQVKLPSGALREGVIFYRSVDADYATQRDVSRTKRDIKTFEIRLRCDNSDRSLAVGMTAYVAMPLK